MNVQLTPHVHIEQSPNHIHVAFEKPYAVLSCAVLNGGFQRADRILNLKVPKTASADAPPQESPADSLSAYCRRCGWNGTTVGMMTASSMASLRIATDSTQGVDTIVFATTGLSNARRAGDTAEYRIMGCEQAGPPGTINLIVFTTAVLSQAAMVEAVMTITEAKSASLQAAGIKSPVSNAQATGTGTDAVALASGHGPVQVQYCGKHVLFGEILARLVIESITSSINWKPIRP